MGWETKFANMAVLTSVPTLSDIWQGERRIAAVEALPGHFLRVSFLDGESYDLDFSRKVGRGETTWPLTDPAVFAQVQVAEDGYSIMWPTGYDNGSDTLRWDGELARRGLTRADVGE